MNNMKQLLKTLATENSGQGPDRIRVGGGPVRPGRGRFHHDLSRTPCANTFNSVGSTMTNATA